MTEYVHPIPEIVNPRQIYWCWIQNDPFFPVWHEEDDLWHCSYCNMVRDEAVGKDTDIRTWDYYHMWLGGVGQGLRGKIISGHQSLIGYEINPS